MIGSKSQHWLIERNCSLKDCHQGWLEQFKRLKTNGIQFCFISLWKPITRMCTTCSHVHRSYWYVFFLLLYSFYRPSRWWRATWPRSTRPEWRPAGLPIIITTTVHSLEELMVEERINDTFCLLPRNWPHYDSRCFLLSWSVLLPINIFVS